MDCKHGAGFDSECDKCDDGLCDRIGCDEKATHADEGTVPLCDKHWNEAND